MMFGLEDLLKIIGTVDEIGASSKLAGNM